MNTCKCTCENPTCSCAPTEVTAYYRPASPTAVQAYADNMGGVHTTKIKALASDLSRYFNNKSGYMSGDRMYASRMETILEELQKMDILKID